MVFMSVISALRQLRHDCYEFEVNLGSIVRPVSTTKKKRKGEREKEERKASGPVSRPKLLSYGEGKTRVTSFHHLKIWFQFIRIFFKIRLQIHRPQLELTDIS